MKTRTKIAIARTLQRAVTTLTGIGADGAPVQVRRKDIEWELDLGEGIDFAIWLQGAFEPGTVRTYQKLIKPGDTVIDVGANVGAHTLRLAQAVGPEGRIVAIEPTDWAVTKLRRNIELNPALAARITVIQAKLEERGGAVEVEPIYSSWPLGETAEGSHPLHLGRPMDCSGARRESLDALVAELELDRVDLVKIDIDGFECEMLAGAQGLLERQRPAIVFELAPYVLDERGGSTTRLLELLGANRYSLSDADSGRAVRFDPEFLQASVPRGGCRNLVAQPRAM